ncbi:S46 family peptidase [Riemerella columbipharyngis]|uniref:Dipeptidyl-peptidase n=1 Tax=Riemerella columbipharyngis TaxID=1071918 RepID=A0A1G7BTC4_9FLAO|nr:S46 family peptidase [Riemerella columbipharyngis]SDE30247.1 Peptidase S46 [Riemerella columbipharyngis]
MIKKIILLSAIVMPAVAAFAQQNGGMWIPTELNEQEMKELGMKISAKDIFNPNKPAINDAVVHFNGGCTGEVISPRGLLLTNHHCGYGQIQAHSTLEHDYLTEGFWAKTTSEELPNPGLYVDFITDIKDVTSQVLGANKNASDAEIKRNIDRLKEEFKLKPYQSVDIVPMYYGNKYYAFVKETFNDVRLVGAPPSGIGKFGSDTDNWVWPRHSGDFSMFRIYADKNNQPAEYSKDNVPYKPKYFLPISIKDKKENQFTFVFGFPGRTQEYLPSIAIDKIVNEIDPARIAVRDVALKTLDEKMRKDDATRIKYAAKYASVANYWKKWIGEVEGLKKSKAVQKRQQYEAKLISLNPNIKPTIETLTKLYEEQSPYAVNDAYYGEMFRNCQTLRLASNLMNLVAQQEKGKSISGEQIDYIDEMYRNYDAMLDAKVMAKVLALYQQKNNPNFLPQGFSKFSDVQKNMETLDSWTSLSLISGQKTFDGKVIYSDLSKLIKNPEFVKALKADPYYQLASELRAAYRANVMKSYNDLQEKIDHYQKEYMAEQMATDKQKKFFPDANSTLRVSYGQVKGSNPRDAVYYGYQTHLGGIMEKYIPGDYEFDVPQKLINLYNSKDYGVYKDKTGEVPVNFTATNHTTGGNSGSPVLDAYGNLMGLNFDRQWEGTMSDINFDPKLCRNIMVDTKYILFVIDKYANAKHLVNEMKVVK